MCSIHGHCSCPGIIDSLELLLLWRLQPVLLPGVQDLLAADQALSAMLLALPRPQEEAASRRRNEGSRTKGKCQALTTTTTHELPTKALLART